MFDNGRNTPPARVVTLPAQRPSWSRIAAHFLVIVAFCSVAAGETPARRIVQRVGIDQHLDAQIPLDLGFRDEQGHVVKLGDYLGRRPVILTLVYYQCPMLCTQVLNGLLESSQAIPLEIGKDYDVVTISIDPRESVQMAREKKQRYVSNYHRPGAEQGWHFLVGDQESIDRLTKVTGFRYVYDERTKQYAHASGIIVLTPAGRISRYFYGIDYPPDDLRLGLVESSNNRIGTLADQFLLLCYHYDPATGRYGFVIDNVIRLAGLITMISLGSYLYLMFRHERRRSVLEAHCAVPSVMTGVDQGHPR